MKILDIAKKYNEVLKQTAEVILAGGLVVFPSDTVYGLMVDPTNKKAVKKLLDFKNRWTGKAISVAVLNKKMAMEYVNITINDEYIYSSLLPGPFTIISNGKHKLVKGIEAENGTLGIRIPDNKYIHDLVKILKKPVTATSANLIGRKPNYSIQGFLKTLSKRKKEMIDLIVDAGKLPRNKPSTVVDLTGSEIKVLRRGDLITGSTKQTLISGSEKETEKIAEFLLKKQKTMNRPLVFLLSGELGCGKTVFSRKIGRLLGVKDKITSPTFVIYNEYTLKGDNIKKFLHMDLYKITTEKDLEEIKILDLFEKNSVSCIEWPENMGRNYLKKLKKKAKIISVNFNYLDEKTREIQY
jgi:L-threonylcarbamoyladenylate synthase